MLVLVINIAIIKLLILIINIASPWEACEDDKGEDEEGGGDEEAGEVELVGVGVVGHVLLVHAAGRDQIRNVVVLKCLWLTLCSCSTSCLSHREPTLELSLINTISWSIMFFFHI